MSNESTIPEGHPRYFEAPERPMYLFDRVKSSIGGDLGTITGLEIRPVDGLVEATVKWDDGEVTNAIRSHIQWQPSRPPVIRAVAVPADVADLLDAEGDYSAVAVVDLLMAWQEAAPKPAPDPMHATNGTTRG